MIVAVCLNPAVDVTYPVAEHVPGRSHRVGPVTRRAGGKGVNAVRVAAQLGQPALLIGLAGGPAGAEIAAELAASGIVTDLVPIEGMSRQTVTVVDPSGATTFNEPGPVITEAEWSALLSRFAKHVGPDTVVALSGSLPGGVASTAYAQLTGLSHEAGASVIVDADGEALVQALAARPDIVKPNAAEAADLLGRPVVDSAAALDAARHAVHLGAGAAVVSRGADGCIAATPDGAFIVRLPFRVSGNPTGAGDALVATLARGLARGVSWPDLLADASAVAAAAVAVPAAGGFDVQLADRLRPQISVERA